MSHDKKLTKKRDPKHLTYSVSSEQSPSVKDDPDSLLLKKNPAQQRRSLGARPTNAAAVLGGQADPEDGIGTSIFDPVLCELAYLWFTGKGMHILDPFAGGSVRGIVAAKLDRLYTGIDLRPEQVDANLVQANEMLGEHIPNWIVGNSEKIKTLCKGCSYDFVFSCPPYGDLEIYSDDPKDLSNMSWDNFLISYREIIAGACSLLKDDRFACFVVGDFRDKSGFYRNFVSETITAFLDAGLKLYNEAILVTGVGSLPIRAGRPFVSSRKLGKTHQNVLVFVKGSPEKAAAECGEVLLPELEATHEIIAPIDGVSEL